MNKKLLFVALAFAALVFTSSAFADPSTACANGATLQAVIVGSSAQFNTFAYAAEDIITTASPAGLGTGPFNLFSIKGLTGSGANEFYTAAIQDVRPTANNALDSASLWVVYDTPTGTNKCNVFAYYSVDSTVGNRAYYAAVHTTIGTKTYSSAGVLPCLAGQSAAPCGNTATALDVAGFCSGACVASKQQNLIGGQSDTFAAPNDFLPTTVYTALTSPVGPTSTNKPAPYCGQLFTTNSNAAWYCYFNAAATDIRPEDAFYATSRALAVPATGLIGMNYNSANCKSGGDATCQIYDSFGQNGTFNILKFNVTGKDPYDTTATVPGYTTLSVGASPVMVEVADSDVNGLGSTVAAAAGKTTYLFNDILRRNLAHIFNGTTYCSGDILSGAALKCEGTDSNGNPTPLGCGFGAGPALQVVHREPLSGTYNTFEFTGVRTLGGSSNAATTKPSATLAWTSDDDGGQEMWAAAASSDLTNAGVFPWYIDPGAPSMGWSSGTLSASCGGDVTNLGGINVATRPTTGPCSDPLFITATTTTTHCKSGTYERMRAIGTGQEVPDVLGLNAGGVTDGIGYAFWSFGNFSKSWASGAPIGHYLTVDGIDPLFPNPSARTDGQTPNTFPNCDGGTSSTIVLPCSNNIPFTHIFDGSYPLWSLLRVVTLPNVTGKTQVPAFVQDLIAFNEQEVDGSTRNISDFAPFLTNLTNTGTISVPVWKGDLNLGVFRVHYKEGTGAAAVNPANGHAQCAGVFSGVGLTGGTSHSAACLVDTGSDVGGSVMTVQSDVDFNLDFGGTTTEGVALGANYEVYDQRQ